MEFQSLYLKKETSLILSCARLFLTTCSSHDLPEKVSKKINWNRLVNEAIQRRLLYFVFRALDTHAKDPVPEDVLSRMQTLCAENATRTLVQSAALIRLLRLFEQHGIPVISFKGPILSQMIYGVEHARIFTDLDILVPRKDAIRARDLLLANDCITDLALPQSQEQMYLEKENFFHLFNRSGTLNIDLHWELTGRYAQQPVFFEQAIKHAQSVMLCGHSLSTLGYEETLLYLCIHGAGHCWDKLEMLFAVATIVKRHSCDIVWQNVFEKADQLRVRTMVILGVKLAQVFFYIPLPAPIEKEMESAKIRSLLGYIMPKICFKKANSIEAMAWRFSPFHFRVRDNFRDAVAYAGRLLFQPTITDWQVCPLPDNLIPLYHLIRPCRLCKEAMERFPEK